ncbi:hypothetical protein COO60DRAFT_1507254 [Scenedesmus sp. NREL 46B-D3]|nr:hypothetical protein COO60DRAFT_1507254 [Scenedesmus sp. NREL 46B-D3]
MQTNARCALLASMLLHPSAPPACSALPAASATTGAPRLAAHACPAHSLQMPARCFATSAGMARPLLQRAPPPATSHWVTAATCSTARAPPSSPSCSALALYWTAPCWRL